MAIKEKSVKKYSVRGKPRKFQTVEELENAIDNYLSSTPIEEWTITGLALALDTTRRTLCDYQNDAHLSQYSHTIKKAKAMIENSYELSMRKNSKIGDIFALKNFGWKDKQEVENSGTIAYKPILGGISNNNGNSENSEAE